MAEIDLEQTIEDDVQISLDENNEFNDLEEIQETASFLKISELKLKCRARNLRLKEEDVILLTRSRFEPMYKTRISRRLLYLTVPI
jgi:hypothetical protein